LHFHAPPVQVQSKCRVFTQVLVHVPVPLQVCCGAQTAVPASLAVPPSGQALVEGEHIIRPLLPQLHAKPKPWKQSLHV
jgi:hypothetical protein